jgi:hypothetical protein
LQGVVGLDKLDTASVRLCRQADDKYDGITGRIVYLTQVNCVSKDRVVIRDVSKVPVLLVIKFSRLDKLIPDGGS